MLIKEQIMENFLACLFKWSQQKLALKQYLDFNSWKMSNHAVRSSCLFFWSWKVIELKIVHTIQPRLYSSKFPQTRDIRSRNSNIAVLTLEQRVKWKTCVLAKVQSPLPWFRKGISKLPVVQKWRLYIKGTHISKIRKHCFRRTTDDGRREA